MKMIIKKQYRTTDRIRELVDNLKKIDACVTQGQNQVTLQKADFVTPLSVLPISVYSQTKNVTIDYTAINSTVRKYLERIGFPKGCDNWLKAKNYAPICRICNFSDATLDYFIKGMVSGGQLQENPIQLLTSELQNNVAEHSKINHYWIQAQHFPRTKNCELSIADIGQGMKQSYSGTKYEVLNDRDAINQAITGVSSKDDSHGHGIPTVINLITKGYKGELLIMSGTELVYINQHEKKNISIPICWEGTSVWLKFPVKNDIDYTKFIAN